MVSAALMQPDDPNLPPTLAGVVRDYNEHAHSAGYELKHGSDERAAIHATLAIAAAQMAQALALVGGEAAG